MADELEMIDSFIKNDPTVAKEQEVAEAINKSREESAPPVEVATKEPVVVEEEQAKPADEVVPAIEPVDNKDGVENKPTDDTVKEPVIDRNKILEELSGGKIKSEEDLKKVLEDANKNTELLNSDEYQYASKLKEWDKQGYPKELFEPIQSLDQEDIDAMSIEDTLKVKMKFENPDFSEEDIDLLFKSKYKQDKDENTEQDIRLGRLMMQQDVRGYKEKLVEMKNLTYIPSGNDRAIEAQQNEVSRQNSWKQEVPKFVKEFNEISIPLDEKGSDVFKWVPTEKQKQELQAEMEKIVLSANIKFDEQGINAFKNVMRKEFVNKHLTDISRAIASRATSKTKEAEIKKYNNPTGSVNEPAPAGKKQITEGDIMDQIAKEEGIRVRR